MAKKKQMDKLSQEVAKALAANMSYGKWKAMQKSIVPPTPKAIPEGWKECEFCGKRFQPKKTKRQKYCSYDCQQKGYYATNRKAIIARNTINRQDRKERKIERTSEA
jgi:hypothetical protein